MYVLALVKKNKQESLADAARVWRPPSEEIYSKSTICDFLLMVALLTVCEILSRAQV